MENDNDYIILESCESKIREMLNARTGINKIFAALKNMGFSGNRIKLVSWLEEKGLWIKRMRRAPKIGLSSTEVLNELRLKLHSEKPQDSTQEMDSAQTATRRPRRKLVKMPVRRPVCGGESGNGDVVPAAEECFSWKIEKDREYTLEIRIRLIT